MKTVVPVGLGRQRLAGVLLAAGFLGLEFVWFLLLFALILLRRHAGFDGLGPWTLAAGGALLANTWGLARSVKSGHFLWLFGRWDQPSGDFAAGGPLLQQARQAWRDGDFERVVLLARKPEAAGLAGLAQGQAHSLALLGRLDEAAGLLRQGDPPARALRWLEPRRSGRAYFGPGDARWAFRHVWLVLLAALSLFGALSGVDKAVQTVLALKGASFSVQGFEAYRSGPFTLYYHDPAFRDLAAELADAALAKELKFFGREDAVLPPGAMRIYLCETREEYLRRAPSAPSWEQASALPALDSIYIHRLPPEQRIYFESVLAHELSHLLYHRFYPVAGNDAWLNEGLADYLGYAFALDRAGFARQAWLDEHVFRQLEGRIIPFDRFFQVDPHQLPSTQEVGTFYRQGFSIVFLLVEHYGQKSFLNFLHAYRRRDRDVAAALAEAYPTIQNTAELASVWGLFYGH